MDVELIDGLKGTDLELSTMAGNNSPTPNLETLARQFHSASNRCETLVQDISTQEDRIAPDRFDADLLSTIQGEIDGQVSILPARMESRSTGKKKSRRNRSSKGSSTHRSL